MPRLKHSNNSENPSPNQYRAPYKTAHQKHLRKHIAPFCEVRSFLIPARPFRSHLATVALERPSAFPVLEMALTFSDTRTRELPYHVLATSATRESNMSTSVSSRRRPIMRLMRSQSFRLSLASREMRRRRYWRGRFAVRENVRNSELARRYRELLAHCLRKKPDGYLLAARNCPDRREW